MIINMAISPFPIRRVQQDQVPILVNDTIEDETLSWDITQIDGRDMNFHSKYFRILSSFIFSF